MAEHVCFVHPVLLMHFTYVFSMHTVLHIVWFKMILVRVS